MLSVAPLERVDDAVVDPHGDGAAHDGQGGRGDHGDDAQLEQRQQAHHQPRQHHACPLRVLPVDQVHHWRTAKRAGDSVDTVKILDKWRSSKINLILHGRHHLASGLRGEKTDRKTGRI